MKKKLNIDSIANELEGASLFFTKRASPPPAPESISEKHTAAIFPTENKAQEGDEIKKASLTQQEHIETQVPTISNRKDTSKRLKSAQSKNKESIDTSLQASNNASMHASNQPLIHETIIEIIRKAVKAVGKDSATYRFTPEEKKALLELSFSYKMQGYKTSENELVRIAINFILEDQKQNGRNSVLQRVLEALSK